MRFFHRFRKPAPEAFIPETSDKWHLAAFAILITFIATAPFLYVTSPGAVRAAMGGGVAQPVGNMLLELFAFAAAAATFLSKSKIRSLRPLAVPLTAAAALAFLGTLQLLPLPRGVLEEIALVNLKLYHESAQILGLFSRGSPQPRISIAPRETAGVVLLLLAYVALFLSAANLLTNRLRRRLFAATLFATATFQILAAAILEELDDRLRGLFVNPNHFAGYLEIVWALALGTLWAEVLTSSDRARGSTDSAERLEKRFLPFAGRILLCAVVAGGIALTQSRGGILSAAITTLVLLTLALLSRRHHLSRRAAAVAALALAAGALFTLFGFLRFVGSDPRDFGRYIRVALWRTSLDAWREFPLLGSGLGTFREAFRRVQPRDLPGLVEHAHSDSLQLLVTGGAVGASLGILLFVSLFVLLFRAWRRQKHREESAMVLAGLGALLSLTLHGLVEFNLSIPVIPATLACALGAAWAAGRSRCR